MPAIIRFTPITGANDENGYCYLLDIDGFRILLDCGWSDLFDVKAIEAIQKYSFFPFFFFISLFFSCFFQSILKTMNHSFSLQTIGFVMI